MKTNKGKITQSLVSYGDEKCMRIELQDENGLLVTRINMSIEQFGYLIAGISHNSCEYNLYDNYELLGKKAEGKIELIDIENNCYNSKEFKDMMSELVKPYEIDGWEANENDIKCWNHHNYSNGKYKVSFSRYI